MSSNIPATDKPFYLTLLISILTSLFAIVAVVNPAVNTNTQLLQTVFTFFSGLMAMSWGFYFSQKSTATSVIIQPVQPSPAPVPTSSSA